RTPPCTPINRVGRPVAALNRRSTAAQPWPPKASWLSSLSSSAAAVSGGLTGLGRPTTVEWSGPPPPTGGGRGWASRSAARDQAEGDAHPKKDDRAAKELRRKTPGDDDTDSAAEVRAHGQDEREPPGDLAGDDEHQRADGIDHERQQTLESIEAL